MVGDFKPGHCPSCKHAQHVGRACAEEIGTEFKRDDAGSWQESIRCGCLPDSAIKADSGKPSDFRLLAWEAIPEVLEVYRYGISKGYERDSWRQVDPTRYEDALVRHVLAMLQGEERDKESGLRHIAHAAWNCLTLICLRKP